MTAGTAHPDRSLSTARGAQSRRFRLDEAEAQVRVARSPYTTDEQRLERYLWAAFLAARHADENPASFRACRILQRSAQGFLAAWRAVAARSERRLFFVAGERFEVARPPLAEDAPRGLRWSFDERIEHGRRVIGVRLLPRPAMLRPAALESRSAAAVLARPGTIVAA